MTTRRSLLRGFALASATAGTAALAVVPVAAEEAHPDAALLAAEAVYLEALSAYQVADARLESAVAAYNADLGLCPSALVLDYEERGLVSGPASWRGGFRSCRLRWSYAAESAARPDDDGSVQVWTAKDLRTVIAQAVPTLGPGGRTPFLIRRWKAILPVAEAWDARCDHLEALYRLPALRAASREAGERKEAASHRFARMNATTVEGLAAKVRYMADCDWRGMGRPWTAFFLSAAAVTGVQLPPPRFDVASWAREVREAGGSVRWNDATGEARLNLPVDHRHTPEQRTTLTRLWNESSIHGGEIRFWFSQGGVA